MSLAETSTSGRMAVIINVSLRWKVMQGDARQRISLHHSLITCQGVMINALQRLWIACAKPGCPSSTYHGGWKSSTRSRTWEYEVSRKCLRRPPVLAFPGQAICSRHALQYISYVGVLLILTHKLSPGSPPIPRHSSIHAFPLVCHRNGSHKFLLLAFLAHSSKKTVFPPAALLSLWTIPHISMTPVRP